MKVAILNCGIPFVAGGAERHATDLFAAVQAAGHECDLIDLPFKNYPPSRILDHALAYRLLDLSETCGTRIDRVIALKFPAYLVPHPAKVIWMCHQHRPAYELWDHPLSGDLLDAADGRAVRDAIRRMDRQFIPEARTLYTISQTVSKRLRDFCDMDAGPLYHPPRGEALFFHAEAGDYLFFPSRINRLKRQLLVVLALGHCRNGVRVRFAGGADHPEWEAECRHAARRTKVDDRIEWLGTVSEEEKRELYAHALGVVFPPVDEDYGYVTLEAMLSAKAVITCSDSGGPLEFVEDGVTGFIPDPSPRHLAAAMDRMWSDRGAAAAMGQAALKRYRAMNISWESTVKRLLA